MPMAARKPQAEARSRVPDQTCRRPRTPATAAVVAIQVFYLLKLPHNYFGGASFIGNRYLAAFYPAFAFLLVRAPRSSNGIPMASNSPFT